MRTGYGIAQKEVIKSMHKLRPPFNITNLSLAAAIEALKDEIFVQDSIKKNFIEMKRYEEYATKNSFSYIESYTNFITLKFNNMLISSEVALNLLKRGVIIRDLSSYGVNAIRITIGSEEQNTQVFRILDEVLEEYRVSETV